VCIDANENIYTQALGKMLTNPEGLGMVEAVGAYTGKKIGPTYFRGQKPIDGIWTTPDITIANACVMPAGYGIGDHRMFIVDIHTSSLVGDGPPRERRAASRRLNTRLPHVAKKYIENLESNLKRHRLIEKLGEAHMTGTSREDVQGKVTKVDKDSLQFMKHAAKKCRKLKNGRICFSPESVIWIKREQIYNSLLQYKLGNKNKNRGNLKRAARRNGIQHPFQISTEELKIRLEMCDERNNYFRENGSRYRKKHLLQRVEVARREGRHEAVKTILTIIKREQDRDFWRRLNYTCGKTKGGSPTSVQVSAGGDDQYTEYTTQESVHKAIWSNIHYKRFYLAEEAPICQGQLCQD
jgi:hypothetical protein